MNTTTVTHDCIKLVDDTASPNLLRSLPQNETIQKKPVQFATAFVHEVRNPLTNIELSIQMLEKLITDKDTKAYLDIIARSSKRINDIVTGFLIQQEVHETHPEIYSLHELLDEVLEMAGDRIRLKNINAEKDYTNEDCTITLDKAKIKICLTNIIVNAIDAMTAGTGNLKLATRCIDGKYIIQISDNGCGISKENLRNIFKPYYTNKPGGLGLGLAATYEILKSNHVGINVESQEGRGSRFTLFFDTTTLV